MQEFEYYEDEEEDEEEPWPMMVRYEVIEYILRRYGALQAKDIARILGCKVRDVNAVLKHLERSGRIRKEKLGRNFVWCPSEESHLGVIYY